MDRIVPSQYLTVLFIGQLCKRYLGYCCLEQRRNSDPVSSNQHKIRTLRNPQPVVRSLQQNVSTDSVNVTATPDDRSVLAEQIQYLGKVSRLVGTDTKPPIALLQIRSPARHKWDIRQLPRSMLPIRCQPHLERFSADYAAMLLLNGPRSAFVGHVHVGLVSVNHFNTSHFHKRIEHVNQVRGRDPANGKVVHVEFLHFAVSFRSWSPKVIVKIHRHLGKACSSSYNRFSRAFFLFPG
uniref:(northern house mosquito) hypothetical protein n=1 Tax=Culex pipiens TaxID=7175 RepID=A0A8D8NHU5_CULPI